MLHAPQRRHQEHAPAFGYVPASAPAPRRWLQMPTREAVAQEIRDFLQHDENLVHVDSDKVRGYFTAAKGLLRRALPYLQSDREGAELERLKAAAIIVLSTTEQTRNPKVRRITAHADFTAGCEILARLLGSEIATPKANGRHA